MLLCDASVRAAVGDECRLLPRDSGLETSSDVELDTTPSPPSPKRVSAFQTDPGHMLAKLNCAGGPATATESADQTRYEFSVEVALAPTIFSATKVFHFASCQPK